MGARASSSNYAIVDTDDRLHIYDVRISIVDAGLTQSFGYAFPLRSNWLVPEVGGGISRGRFFSRTSNREPGFDTVDLNASYWVWRGFAEASLVSDSRLVPFGGVDYTVHQFALSQIRNDPFSVVTVYFGAKYEL